MPNTKYVAGHFVAFYSPAGSGSAYQDCGSTREGWRLRITLHEQDVHDDAFGQGIADTIQEGADATVEGLSVAAGILQATNAILWAQQSAEGKSNNNVGLRGSDLYGSLKLTPIAGTPAAATIGAGNSYFFDLAAVANNIEMLLGSGLREIPITFKVLPNQANGNQLYRIAAS